MVSKLSENWPARGLSFIGAPTKGGGSVGVTWASTAFGLASVIALPATTTATMNFIDGFIDLHLWVVRYTPFLRRALDHARNRAQIPAHSKPCPSDEAHTVDMKQFNLDSGRAVAAVLALVAINAMAAILARASFSALLPVPDGSGYVSSASAGSNTLASRPLYARSALVVPASLQMPEPGKSK